MSTSIKLGLGNSVNENTVIFHGSICSRDSFGRVTDLLVVWTKKEHSLSQKLSGDLRVMVQGLLEFGFPSDKPSIGHLELAIEDQKIYVGLRFENFIVNDGDDVEKKLAQYWLNSEESSLIKKILYSQDCVEVRFQKELNLLEWRIIRSLNADAINLEAITFQVFTATENGLNTQHQQFVEMGDVRYEDWIQEVYQNTHEKNNSGELIQNGESVQDEEEWARVVFEHDQKVVEESLRVFKANAEKNELAETKLSGKKTYATASSVQLNAEENSGAVKEVTSSGGEESETDDEVKLSAGKKSDIAKEVRPTLEVSILNEKVRQYEKLLKQKERQKQKMSVEVATLQKKMSDAVKNVNDTDSKQIQLFRDKAMKMFEMVKTLQTEKQALEKTVFEAKHNTSAPPTNTGAKSLNEAPGLMIQIEELTKKSERLTRALETEKEKIKGLADRAMVAEREAQSSTPLISDLENKVEAALKMAQQNNKETDQVKLKLVQSEAEKNKIKNDLVKAQAQIQTMMKRQAS